MQSCCTFTCRSARVFAQALVSSRRTAWRHGQAQDLTGGREQRAVRRSGLVEQALTVHCPFLIPTGTTTTTSRYASLSCEC